MIVQFLRNDITISVQVLLNESLDICERRPVDRR